MHSLMTSILFPKHSKIYLWLSVCTSKFFSKKPEKSFLYSFCFCFFQILNSNCSKAIKDYVVMFYIRISIRLLFCCLLVQHVSFFIIKSTSYYVMFESRDICHGRGQYFTAILFELPLQ